MTLDEQQADTQRPAQLAGEIPCHCPVSVPWAERRYDGVWEDLGLEQRTCRVCGASFTKEIGQ